MESHHSSTEGEDQFSIESSFFVSETISGTAIRLLHARPETEPAIAQQLAIPHRLELLCAQARRRAKSLDHSQFIQDASPVGKTSNGETVYLVLSATLKSGNQAVDWFVAAVPEGASKQWQDYLSAAREAIVTELRRDAEGQG